MTTPAAKRDTTIAWKLAREIRLTIGVRQLTPRVLRLFERLERTLLNMDARTGRRDPAKRPAQQRAKTKR